MHYRQLGSTGLRVSELCLGTVYFGTQVTPAESERVIRRALDLGMNFVDTAEIYMRPRYGASEEIVGKALVGRRHEVVLATKKRYDPGIFRTGTPADHSLSRSQIIAAIEGSLRRLQTDYVDLYYPHHVDLVVSLEETLRAIDDLVRAGKVRYVGLSNHPTWKVIRALWIADRLGLAPIIASQALYNLLDRAIERELIPASQQFGLGIVAYSPLAGGVLTAKYSASGSAIPAGSRAAVGGFAKSGRPAHIPVLSERNLLVARRLAALAAARNATAGQLALAWVLQQPQVSSAIVGASTVAQLEENVRAAELRLSETDLTAVTACASDE
jgi:aryl-alcohol dehydrogenase-like predicted oxidoreductase